MPDERTNSTITWFNSALPGNQSAQTLIDMIQVGQWWGKHLVCVYQALDVTSIDQLADINIISPEGALLASHQIPQH